ncbi:MAG: 6-bladed beta-propeller, partial [Actinomycetota bacterium]
MLRGRIRKYILATAVLLVILAGLIFLVYLLSRPPTNIGAKSAEGYRHLFSIYGFEGDRLYRPTEVAIDKNGNIYVADTFKHRIVVFDSTGKFIRMFGEKGEKPTQIQFPSAVAVAPDGRVYVLSATQNKIVVYRGSKPYWVINVEKPLAVTIKKNRLYITTARGIMIGDL